MANTIDPLGGSYFVEALTDRMESQARDYFRRIDELGGVLPAIQKGFFQREIADAAYRYQHEIDEKQRVIVGVNAFEDEAPISIPLLEMDPEGLGRQIARLKQVRRDRDSGRVGQALDRLRIAAQGTENLMPHLLEAVRSYATLGEIVALLKGVLGTYPEPNWI